MLAEQTMTERQRIQSRERQLRYLARKKQAGLVQVNLMLTAETKARLAKVVQQAGSHEAAIQKLFDCMDRHGSDPSS